MLVFMFFMGFIYLDIYLFIYKQYKYTIPAPSKCTYLGNKMCKYLDDG